jgi:redox-sensitive bicupin YhaK (pirin superfamily)
MSSKYRNVKSVIQPQLVIEGADVRLRRSIAPQVSNLFDPFLLFDHFAFNEPQEGPLRGFPMHPHRGIETVTYILDGSVQHRDSLGNSGVIGAGDVQWMTSGRGIMHEELPRRGASGAIDGFQLWVNLPAALKMSAPRYQEVKATTIPAFEQDGVKVRVVAGTSYGITGPVTQIAAEPLYLEVNLAPGAEFVQDIPDGHTTLAYVFDGEGVFGAETVDAVSMVTFEDSGTLRVRAENSAVRFMVIAGAPFKEPIAPYGPFVMNTREEIQQALRDLRSGTFVS